MVNAPHTTNLPASLKDLEDQELRHICPNSGHPIFNEVPAGHFTVLVKDLRHYPILRTGDQVLIDGNDCEIEYGELFLIRHSTRDVLWQVRDETEKERLMRAQETRHIPCVYLCPLDKLKSWETNEDLIARSRVCRLHLTDGPVFRDHIEKVILGRVVGVYNPNELA